MRSLLREQHEQKAPGRWPSPLRVKYIEATEVLQLSELCIKKGRAGRFYRSTRLLYFDETYINQRKSLFLDRIR